MTTKIISTKLPNGATVLLAPDNRAPVVAFYNWVRVGSADETDREAGLAHVLEHMLFKGTTRRGVGQIAQEIEGCGGDINAFTSFDTTVYHLVVASRFFDQGLDVIMDSVTNSIIDPAELAMEKEVILEEIKRGQDSPQQKLGQGIFSAAYKTHPYRRPVIGFPETVSAASRDMIFGFYQRWYVPSNMVFVVAGDFDLKDALRKVRAAFKRVEGRRGPTQRRVKEPAQNGFRGCILTSDVHETFFDGAFHIPGASHADVVALDLLSVALGQGDQSRLGWRLRRQDQLVNYVGAYSYTPRDPGLMMLSGASPVEKIKPAVHDALEEMFAVLSRPLSAQELERARVTIEGDAVYERETVQGVAKKLGFFATVLGDVSYEQKYYAAVAKTTPADIARVAQKYLTPSNLTFGMLAREEGQLPDLKTVKSWAATAYKTATAAPKARRPVQSKPKPGSEQLVKLANGARLVLRYDPQIPLLAVRGVFLGGLRHETDATNGLSNLVARLHGKGTSHRTYTDVLRSVDSWAGSMSGFAGFNSFGLRMEVLSKHAEDAVELFCESLLDPAFRERELEVERGHVLEAIKTATDDPSSYAIRTFQETLFERHPFRMSLLGASDRVAAYTASDLQQFYAARATADNLVVSVVGDIDPARAADWFHARLGTWKSANVALPEPTQEVRPSKRREVTRYKEREQAHLLVGFLGVRLNEPDRFPLEVLASVLAGQGGRLFLELRDKQGLAYSVTAFSQEALDPGYFAVYMGTDPRKLDRALEGIHAELARIRREPITKDELLRNKRQLVGAYEIDLQKASSRAATLAFNERYGLGYDHYRTYAKKVLAVTVEDVLAIAQRYLDPAQSVTAVVKPENILGHAAAEPDYGPIASSAP